MARPTIGCALWSLAIPDTVRALERAAELGFEAVQFAFCRAGDLESERRAEIAAALERTGLETPAGMIAFAGEDYASIASIRRTGGLVMPGTFPERLEHTRRVGPAIAELGITHVTTHAGSFPQPGGDAWADALARVRHVAEALGGCGLAVGLETGQETSAVLLRVLDEVGLDFVSVNFDPANFVLYGTQDPVEAARALAPRVTLMHAKDAAWSDRPGETWGLEVPLGEGDVDFPAVFEALREGGFDGPVVIEREAGDDRAGDITAGREFLDGLGC